MIPNFSYIIGPLPFCVPLAGGEPVGPASPYPLELTSLDELCRWVWRVRSWELEITGLSNEFATYADYSFEFANHEKTGVSPPGTVVDIIAGYGLNLEHEFTVMDNHGQPNTFRLRLQGLDGARRQETPERYFPGLVLELDLLLPGNVPPEEIVFRTAAGSEISGALEMEGAVTDIRTGFPGQITDSWVGHISVTAQEEWSFEE